MGKYEDILKDIENTIGIVPGFMEARPKDVLINDWPLWKKYTLGESEIPAKYRELGGLSVAANIKCPYCEAMHTHMAKFHGANDEELSEVYYLASLTARWSAMLHAQHYDWETFLEEAKKWANIWRKQLKNDLKGGFFLSDENQPNVGEDFIRFHKIVTRSLEVALQNVNEFVEIGGLEKSKREGFLKFVQSFSSFLEGHHLVENEKIFPYFKDKLPEVPYERLMAEHKEVEAALQEINSGITSLKSERDESKSLRLLKSNLGKIDVIWLPHIQIEESQLYQRVGSLNINTEEMIRIQKEVSQFFQDHTGPAYLIAPFALYNLNPEDRAILAQGFPEIVTKKLVPIDWKDKWAPMQPFLLKED